MTVHSSSLPRVSCAFDVKTLTQRWPLLRLGIAGWLLVGMPACIGEEAEESVLTEQRDAGAHTREAVAESDRVLAEQRGADAQAQLAAESDRALAERGDAGAQARLGEAHLESGVAQDFGEAVRWARLAAEQGDAGAQALLGFLYGKGNGVAQDFGEAVRWARLAAEQGDAGAQALLGMMYMAGQGVEQDLVSAYMWMSMGASGPGVSSGGALDVLIRLMTPEQIAEAEARARDWGQ